MPDGGLTLEGVHTHLGSHHILQGVDLQAAPGKVTLLLGRNGAGKSTTLRTIMGLWRAARGRILVGGDDIGGLGAAEIARRGVGFVPERDGVFSGLTVAENLALFARPRPGDVGRLDRIFSLFPLLKGRLGLLAGHLSGGQKQMLAVARALAVPHRLILIDEPSKGLAPSVVRDLMAALRDLATAGTTILLAEQNLAAAAGIGDDVVVMSAGRIVHQGPAAPLAAQPSEQRRLLGLVADDTAELRNP